MTSSNIATYATLVGTALEGATVASLAQVGGGNLALLYSAGLDSALLAKICQDAGYRPLLLSFGTDRSKDRRFVERSRPYLELPIEFVTVDTDDIAKATPITRALLREAGIFSDFTKLNRIHLAVGVGTYLACQAAHQRGIQHLLSAHGADALFAGFDRYHRVPTEELATTLEQDVQAAIHTGVARDRAVTDAFTIQLVTPFLEPSVVDLGLRIPIEHKLGPEANKLVLRELARQRGLPDFIARRPKKSMQYSTGVWRIMRELRRRQEESTS